MWRRIKLDFVPSLKVEFTNRDRALRQLEELAERGTRFPVIVYGPEGCGKTALLRQFLEILDDYGYKSILVSPLEEDLARAIQASPSVRDIVLDVLKSLSEPLADLVQVALRVKMLIEKRFARPRIALLFDDLFQAVGLENAEKYVKLLLNLIEHPSTQYENIVIVVSTSEGVTRTRVGRHEWSTMYALWNMYKEGFRRLYEQLPEEKPSFEEVWLWTGGNPRILARLCETRWNVDVVIERIVESRNLPRLVASLSSEERRILEEALEDPDILLERSDKAEPLLNRLIELNLVLEIPSRKEYLWIDVPPPEKDLELGIGRFIAWQTPAHREAMRRALTMITG